MKSLKEFLEDVVPDATIMYMVQCGGWHGDFKVGEPVLVKHTMYDSEDQTTIAEIKDNGYILCDNGMEYTPQGYRKVETGTTFSRIEYEFLISSN